MSTSSCIKTGKIGHFALLIDLKFDLKKSRNCFSVKYVIGNYPVRSAKERLPENVVFFYFTHLHYGGFTMTVLIFSLYNTNLRLLIGVRGVAEDLICHSIKQKLLTVLVGSEKTFRPISPHVL